MTVKLDHTHDIHKYSWLTSANAEGCDFPIQNLPFGVIRRRDTNEPFRGAVAIGDCAIDLAALANTNCFEGIARLALQAAAQERLNALMALGPAAWQALRFSLFDALEANAPASMVRAVRSALVPLDAVEYAVPAHIGDYTDFYTSLYHAANIGRQIRPANPVSANFHWLPIAYHGRVSTLGVSGQTFHRPWGQVLDEAAGTPRYAPCAKLDYELELGAFIGQSTPSGSRIPLEEADRHIFGICLLNDWSARDIQWWEMAPLGPFLAKNFATTLSPWIVTLDALAPYRTMWQRTADAPRPLAYLEHECNRMHGALDITVQVELQPGQSQRPVMLSRTSFRHQYWTLGQMLAHHTSGGCAMNVGDLLGSGTISGPTHEEAGALVELSEGGCRPVDLGNGMSRSFVEDGDTVILRGWCERDGYARIGFGECRGTVLPASPIG